MPTLSSMMTEGKIVSRVKSEGEKLSKGESVLVVESYKADMDVESFHDGYLAAIIVDEGLSAAVGSTIALLAETEEEIAEAQSKKGSALAAEDAAPAPKVLDKMPSATAIAAEKPSGGFIIDFLEEVGKKYYGWVLGNWVLLTMNGWVFVAEAMHLVRGSDLL